MLAPFPPHISSTFNSADCSDMLLLHHLGHHIFFASFRRAMAFFSEPSLVTLVGTNVCFWPKADILIAWANVRYWG